MNEKERGFSMKGYVIMQAEALQFKGPKGDGISSGFYKVYSLKEDAMDFLALIIRNVKREQGQGLRTLDDLDPKVKLDFFIQEVAVNVSITDMERRGWNFDLEEKLEKTNA